MSARGFSLIKAGRLERVQWRSSFDSVKGFTLIELLVVVAIMGILGVATINYGNFSEGQKLNAATADIQSILKLAQTNAATRIYCTSDTGGNGARWWVEFSTGLKTITIVCDNDTTTPLTTQVVNTITLNPSIAVNAISGSSTSCTSGYPVNVVRVNFEPLYATVTFTDPGATPVDCVSSQYLTVTLKNNKTTDTEVNTKQIRIDRGGSVSVQ